MEIGIYYLIPRATFLLPHVSLNFFQWRVGFHQAFQKKRLFDDGALLQLGIDSWHVMYRIGGRLGSRDASLCGVIVGIPPFTC